MNVLLRRFWAGLVASMAVLAACGSEPESDRHEVIGSVQSAIVETMKLSMTLPGESDFRQVAVGANETLRLYNGAQVVRQPSGFAPAVNAGTILTDFGVSAQSGDLTSRASIFLHENSRVNGSATTEGTITTWAGATVTGTSSQNVPLPPTKITWDVPFETSTQYVTIYPGQSQTVAPGAYARITLWNSAQLTLSTGTYYLDQLDLSNASTLNLNTTNGPILLYVKTSVVFRSTIVGGSADRLLLGYFGGLPITFDSNFRGTIVAPAAPVRFATPSTVHEGSIFAKTVEIDPNLQFVYKPYAGWDDIPFNVTPRFECAEQRPHGSRVAHFGYLNPNTKAVTVPIGANNQFVPGVQDRRQPTTFLPGSRSFVFAVT